ncbi:RNA polymerase subunit sigma-70 [Terrimonas sp.]|uniref:RNA polymerase sigma factor n=1 Tax=Terrimonas sp. TaxID=1914338 RepID=UPI00092881B7|nr:RNA polymerase sigma-70 factor [Terrimonas sp.]OJY88163.1 MAG: hypothetical protein BGP13_06350 [Sphingobacteriales bacterium 40-81]PVD50768.1 RNA polymerase subunit sigma-70 [Terrimonas sp.]
MLAHNIHTETELIDLLNEGNKDAFSAIYELHASSLINFAASRLSSFEEARDIIHDVFVNIWDNRATLRITSSLKAYLFAAVRYRIIDHIRKNANRKEYAAMIEQLSGMLVVDEESGILTKDLQHTLEYTIEDLPSRTKEIYRLSRNHHLPVKEIAFKLGLSEQTVKNQLSAALHHLRHSWKKLAVIMLFFFH